jgi:hypothetical protein
MPAKLESYLTPEESILISGLTSPVKIQEFLDTTLYAPEERNRSCLQVLRERQAHCLDGGMFAAAMLKRLAYPPLLIDLLPERGMDDDHILALFRVDGCWGAVAKSNYVGLRYREPVHRSLRELVMTYFEVFFNVDGLRTLRGYTRPINLERFDRYDWEAQEAGAYAVEKYLKTLRVTPLLSPTQATGLERLDPASYKAGMLVANPDGLYKPKK